MDWNGLVTPPPYTHTHTYTHTPEWKEVRIIQSVHLQPGTSPRNDDRLMCADGHRDKKKQRLNWIAREKALSYRQPTKSHEKLPR